MGESTPLEANDRTTPVLISRPVLRDRLRFALRRRVCVVTAAGGWGKTTSVAAATKGCRAAWVSCDGADVTGLLDRVREAVVGQLPASGTVDSAPDRRVESTDGGAAGAMLCDWLHDMLRDDLVLVLDDLGGLDSGDCGRLVERLCHHGPDLLHVVLISRRSLPFSVERLRGRGQLAEIDASELAMDFAEVAALLRATVGERPDGLTGRLWKCTGGWPAAVIAAVDWLSGVPTEERPALVEALSRPGERFHGYLAAEVLAAEPAPVQALLRRLAAFGQVGATGNALAPDGGTRDRTLLADVARRGLVRRSSTDGTRWTLMAPLAEFFLHDAALQTRDWSRVHHATAQECLERGARAEALRHWAAAGNWAQCADLLIEHGGSIVNTGQADAILAVADDLPPHYQVDPRVQAVFGDARVVHGHWAAALASYARAGTGGQALEPSVAWRVAAIAYAQGEFANAVEAAERARFVMEDTPAEARALALAAAARRITGDLDGMRPLVERATRAAARSGEPGALAVVAHVRSMLAAAEGDHRRAETDHRAALSFVEVGGDLLQELWISLWHAFHLLEHGMPRAALEEATDLVRRCEVCDIPFLAALAMTTRAQARTRMGLLDAASEELSTAIEILQRLGTRFVAAPLCGLGDVHRARGQLGRARVAYEEALELADPAGDVFSIGSALCGLARVHALDDAPLAARLAERALVLGEGLREASAHLTRGWVALLSGDRAGAAANAARAEASARRRRHQPELAEAIALAALAAEHTPAAARALSEAVDIYHDAGYPLDEAATRLVAHRLAIATPSMRRGGDGAAKPDLDSARAVLAAAGVQMETRRAAGPLAVLIREAPRVTIIALGVFQVLRDGLPVPAGEWRSRKARDLLKILVARRGPTPREQLMELLWPEADPAKAGNRLSVLLSTVRDVLTLDPRGGPPAGPPLSSDGSTVWLDPAHVAVDVEDVLARAAAALDAHRNGHRDATAALRATADAYTGAFLEDDPYADWATELSEELRATHHAVLRALISRLRPGGDDAGDIDAAVGYMLRLLAQDPYDEQTHVELIAMLRDAGRHGEARRRHEIYARRLRDLGVEPPSPALVRRDGHSVASWRGNGP